MEEQIPESSLQALREFMRSPHGKVIAAYIRDIRPHRKLGVIADVNGLGAPNSEASQFILGSAVQHERIETLLLGE